VNETLAAVHYLRGLADAQGIKIEWAGGPGQAVYA
jgi:hypothetical protein